MPPIEQFRSHESDDHVVGDAISSVCDSWNVIDSWSDYHNQKENTAFILGKDGSAPQPIIVQTQYIEIRLRDGITPVYDVERTILGPQSFIDEVKEQIEMSKAKQASL